MKEIGEGVMFGEVLMRNEKGCIFQGRCMEDTHLGVLKKDKYKKILALCGIISLTREAGFYNTLPFSNAFIETIVKVVYMKEDVVKYHKNQVVYSEGSTVEDVYLVKNGEFTVRMRK